MSTVDDTCGHRYAVNYGDNTMNRSRNIRPVAHTFLDGLQMFKCTVEYMDTHDAEFTHNQRLVLELDWVKAIRALLNTYELARKEYLAKRENITCH